jgi:hypothetical protein
MGVDRQRSLESFYGSGGTASRGARTRSMRGMCAAGGRACVVFGARICTVKEIAELGEEGPVGGLEGDDAQAGDVGGGTPVRHHRILGDLPVCRRHPVGKYLTGYGSTQ